MNETPEPKIETKYLDLVFKLKKLGGENIPYVKWIIDDLEKGDIETAKINCEQQRDKFGSKTEIKELLKKTLWNDGADSPWPTPEEFKRKISD